MVHFLLLPSFLSNIPHWIMQSAVSMDEDKTGTWSSHLPTTWCLPHARLPFFPPRISLQTLYVLKKLNYPQCSNHTLCFPPVVPLLKHPSSLKYRYPEFFYVYSQYISQGPVQLSGYLQSFSQSAPQKQFYPPVNTDQFCIPFIYIHLSSPELNDSKSSTTSLPGLTKHIPYSPRVKPNGKLQALGHDIGDYLLKNEK